MSTWEEVLIRPVVSERTLKIAEEFNEYTFLVARGTDKPKIKEAIEKSFNVKVETVRTKTIVGKTQRRGTKKLNVKMADMKMAIVRLSPKDKIALFETKEKRKKK